MSTLFAGLLILAALAAWTFWALRRLRRRKTHGGCGCCSGRCPWRGRCR